MGKTTLYMCSCSLKKEEREGQTEKISKEIAKDFLNLIKTINTQIQEV